MSPRVTLLGNTCANIFTLTQLIFFGVLSGSQKAGAAARTSCPKDNSRRRVSFGGFSPKACVRLRATLPSRRRARSESPAESAKQQAKSAESRLTFPQH